MKKYVSGFLFFLCLTTGSLLALFFMTKGADQEEAKQVQAVETVEHPAFAGVEPETETMMHLVLNQEQVVAKVQSEKYCLVAEEGYLIVYDKDEETVNLFTHMPLSEFPEAEQEKLLEGIWFPTMAEIFSYLESYSS
ncbi:MAG: hypothetical protein IJ374_01400 [Lachnospiraceae bacterium]|nr:hypothetical protein [Lachnospiraceae bacterium]